MASSVDTNLTDFKINSVASEEVLKQMEQAGLLEPNQIYMTPDEDIENNYTAGVGISIENGVISARQTYSTAEQLTGDYWIDGKPIYTKVYAITLVDNANLEIPYNISNADTIWVDEGNSFILSSGESLPSSWFYTTSDWCRTWINKNYKIIRFKSPDSFAGRTLYVTLKYTKTS